VQNAPNRTVMTTVWIRELIMRRILSRA
jgi:hypothetical protein